jgi:hypothetical protein
MLNLEVVMPRATKKIIVEAGIEKRRVEVEVPSNASEKEIMSAIGRKLIDWKEIERSRHEGDGTPLNDVIREMRGNAKSPPARKRPRRSA